MNIKRIIGNIQKFGLIPYSWDIIVRLINRFTYFNVLVGMTLRAEDLNLEVLPESGEFQCRFVTKRELFKLADQPGMDLPSSFISEALQRSDACFGVFDGEVLASYGWYTNRPTPFTDDLTLHFDPNYTYIYRGYTPSAYRGKRLHALGMAEALRYFSSEGSRGLISYVESSNIRSLRSCYRMGYKPFGKLVVVRLFGRYVLRRLGECRTYRFLLIPSVRADSPQETLPTDIAA